MDSVQSALSSLGVNKKKLEIASANMANASTPGAKRLEVQQEAVVINGAVAGVSIKGIKTQTDALLESSLLERISESSYASTKHEYLQEMNNLLGTPGENDSLDTYITNIFEELNTLSYNLDKPSQKVVTVNTLANAAENISKLASDLENLRYFADTEIGNLTTSLNQTLENAYHNSQQTRALKVGTLEYVQSIDNLQGNLRELSEYFALNQFTNSIGELFVSTKSGRSLVGPDQVYQTEYTPANAASNFTDGNPLNEFYITSLDNNGNQTRLNLTLVPEGVSGKTTYPQYGGKIGALLEMRDFEIPKALNQLDNLAQMIKNEFNKVHNEGAGYPPATTLTGTNLVSRDQVVGFSGDVRIALVDDSGDPFTSPAIPALTLDLAKLNTGSGAGYPNLEGIINEINYHFNQRYANQNSVQMGNLSNINLAAISSAINPSSSFTMDLELANYSGTDSSFNIISVTATDSLGNNLLPTFNGVTATVQSGNTIRTGTSGPSITLNTTAAPLEYPFTVTMQCEVEDNGSTHNATLTFEINAPTPDPVNGIINQRYGASSVSGSATLVDPTLPMGLLSASLVDENGNIIPNNSSTPGLLKLYSTDSKYHIAIDQMNSEYLGDPTSGVLPTYQGFTSFFGLNDLFVRTDSAKNSNQLNNTAINLSIRPDIKNDPNLFSVGTLRQTHSNFANQPIYTYNMTSGDNEVLNNMIELGYQQFLFQKASGLPSATVSFATYAAEIITFNSVETSLAAQSAETNKLYKEAIAEKLQKIGGVDLDQELYNIIRYNEAYSAAAKVIEISRDFYKTLINAF